MSGKQVRVGEYAMKQVLMEHRDKFIDLMIEWEGTREVLNAFYDWDVLTDKHKEAQEFMEAK